MKREEATQGLTYKDAGVDITAGNQLVDQIKPAVKSTYRPGVLGNIGGFGGMFELPWDKYRAPVLVSGTDGVGTKLRLAIDADNHSTIGIDLVAMCVNDIIVTGAEPLFFLDYFATGKLDVNQGTAIIEGIANGCRQAGAALIGGESAEMPGLYHDGDYDLAGFAVGLVEKELIIDGSSLDEGDAIIGLASSGPHSNGFSLIRSVLAQSGQPLESAFDDSGVSLADALLEPTRIYVKSLLHLIKSDSIKVKALAHITGGGLTENIPRALKPGLQADIDQTNWSAAGIFAWLQKQGSISEEEMHRVFNCGIGMVLFVPAAQSDAAIQELEQCGEKAWHIGEIKRMPSNTPASVIVR